MGIVESVTTTHMTQPNTTAVTQSIRLAQHHNAKALQEIRELQKSIGKTDPKAVAMLAEISTALLAANYAIANRPADCPA